MSDLPTKQISHPSHNIPEATEHYQGKVLNDWSGSFGAKEGGPPAGAKTPDTESGPNAEGYMTHSSQGLSYK